MKAGKCPDRVIWITKDHLRYDCIGANGNSAICTPNLDALAADAVNFTVRPILDMPVFEKIPFLQAFFSTGCQIDAWHL